MKENHSPITPKPTCRGLLTSSPTTKASPPTPLETDAPSQTRRTIPPRRDKESERPPSTEAHFASFENALPPIPGKTKPHQTSQSKTESPASQRPAAAEHYAATQVQPLSQPSLQNSSDPIATRTAQAKTQNSPSRQSSTLQQSPATQHLAAIHQLTVSRARRYIDKIPPAVSGEGGHAQTFSVAVTLVHGFALPTHEAWPILTDYNARCVPPWTPEELRHKLQSATCLTHHSRPRGYLVETTAGPHIILRTPSARATKPLKPAGRVRIPERPTALSIPSASSAPAASPLEKPVRQDHEPQLKIYAPPGDLETFPSAPPAAPIPPEANPLAAPTKPTPLERALTTARLYNMNIPEKCCPICWVHWGRSLWIGSCICTGSIKGWEGVRVE